MPYKREELTITLMYCEWNHAISYMPIWRLLCHFPYNDSHAALEEFVDILLSSSTTLPLITSLITCHC